MNNPLITMFNDYSKFLMIAFTLLFSCVGCSTLKKDGVDAHFEIITSNFINPDHNNESRPLNVTLYYLSETEEFLKADYFDLFHTEDDPLAGSLLQKSNVLVLPNARKLYHEEVPENVRAIGVIYQFRKLEESQWRAVIETPEKCFFGYICRSILHSSNLFISIDELNTKIKLVD